MSPISGSTSENHALFPGGAGEKRIDVLDLWRSVCVWMMLAYHAVYDLTLFGALPRELVTHPAAKLYCYLGAGGFILLSGICTQLSHDTIRRGFQVLCAALAVTVVTTLAGYPVAFGVLHLLGLCMLLYGLLRKWIDRWNGSIWFGPVCLALFAVSWIVTSAVQVDITFLFPLGFHSAAFYSADYFPLLPWAFLFLSGTTLGKAITEKRNTAPLLQKRYPPALTFCGRHSLVIYLLHQPVLYGALWLAYHI